MSFILEDGFQAVTDAIEQGIKDTDKASQDFASRRMDKSIRAALAGHSVDEI